MSDRRAFLKGALAAVAAATGLPQLADAAISFVPGTAINVGFMNPPKVGNMLSAWVATDGDVAVPAGWTRHNVPASIDCPETGGQTNITILVRDATETDAAMTVGGDGVTFTQVGGKDMAVVLREIRRGDGSPLAVQTASKSDDSEWTHCSQTTEMSCDMPEGGEIRVSMNTQVQLNADGEPVGHLGYEGKVLGWTKAEIPATPARRYGLDNRKDD